MKIFPRSPKEPLEASDSRMLSSNANSKRKMVEIYNNFMLRKSRKF